MDKFEQLHHDAQKKWADKWDDANPSDFMKACNASRARQEEAKYLAAQKEKLLKQEKTVLK
jgi:hypothetical protein